MSDGGNAGRSSVNTEHQTQLIPFIPVSQHKEPNSEAQNQTSSLLLVVVGTEQTARLNHLSHGCWDLCVVSKLEQLTLGSDAGGLSVGSGSGHMFLTDGICS